MHADKIITENLKKFGKKLFVIYLAKYLYEHQERHKIDADSFKANI